MTRLSWDAYFMQLAFTTAERSTCSRLKVGALLVSNFNVITLGYNGAPKGVTHCDHTNSDAPCTLSVHAEANALVQPRMYTGYETVMFVTHAPCFECAKLIINANITGVRYRNDYRSTQGLELLQSSGILVQQVM